MTTLNSSKAVALYFFVMGILLPFSMPLNAQENGKVWTFEVLDAEKQAVARVTWILKSKATDNTLEYGQSDDNGMFYIPRANYPDIRELNLSLKHLAFESQEVQLSADTDRYTITLQPRTNRIDAVEVGNRPQIRRDGDTLRYLLHDFIDHTDRSIGDALRKLPGITVLESGKILFNGQSISGMLIDGDDLLEGRYGIGTKAISTGVVYGVEVIQGYQPVRVLQGKLASTQVAVNLIIKDKARLALNGDFTVGIGGLDRYLLEANTVLFQQDVKMLNVLKGNSIGLDLEEDQSELVNTYGRQADLSKILSTGLNRTPNLGLKRTFLNHSGGLFINQLFNKKNDWQFKINMDATLQRNTVNYQSRTVIYDGVDSIQFWETQDGRVRPAHSQLNLRATKNSTGILIDNQFGTRYRTAPTSAAMTSERSRGTHTVQDRFWEIRNNLQLIPSLKNKQILNLSWDVDLSNRPESLEILSDDPGSNFISPIDGFAWPFIRQEVKGKRFQSHFHGYYLQNRDGGNFRYIWSIKNKIDHLQSHATGSDDQLSLPHNIWEDNNLQLQDHVARAGIVFFKNWQNIQMTGTLPLDFQYIKYADPGFKLQKDKSYIYVSPSLQLSLLLRNEQRIQFMANRHRDAGSLFDLYSGPILKNYRTLEKKNPVLPDKDLWLGEVQYSFGNSLKMLFFNVGYFANYITQNGTPVWSIENGLLTQEMLDQKQSVFQHGLKAGMQKYFFSLGAKSGLDLRWDQNRYPLYINGNSVPVIHHAFEAAPAISAKISEKWDLGYSGILRWHKSIQDTKNGTVLPGLFESVQSGHIRYLPSKNYIFNFSPHFRMSSGNNAETQKILFLDASFSYYWPAWKTTFQLDVENLLDKDRYQSISQAAHLYREQSHLIRGRSVLLKALFALN